MSVCVGSAWKILPVTARSLSVVTSRAGRPGPPLRGAGRDAISIKEILEENRGPASNQTKIQIFKKIFSL